MSTATVYRDQAVEQPAHFDPILRHASTTCLVPRDGAVRGSSGALTPMSREENLEQIDENSSKKFTVRAWRRCLLFAGAQAGFGQNITTGTLTGVVMDAQKGVLPGATVIATHTPTGTTYEAVTQADGRFTMLAVRVGGPYTVKATMTGFKDAGADRHQGRPRRVARRDFTLALETVTETVTVVAEAQVIDTTRAGTAANIARAGASRRCRRFRAASTTSRARRRSST